MNRFFQNLKLAAPLFVVALVGLVQPVFAQEFREPVVSAKDNLAQAFDPLEEEINPPADQTQPLQSVIQAPSIVEGFVPQATPQSTMQPINPQPTTVQQPFGDSTAGGLGTEPSVLPPDVVRQRSYRPGIERDLDGELQPIIPGRTDLRSAIENLDNWADDEAESSEGPEVIWQNYPDGTPQLMRHVAQDEEGNYYNHGDWKLFNRGRQVLAQGQFYEGVMDGVWKRWHPQTSGGVFSTRPFNLFRGPFLSTASFNKGELDGIWTLQDHFERKIFEIPYRNGIRHGTATWWYPSSMKMREVTFKDGLMDGALLEWNEQDKLVRRDEYIDGKKIIRQTSYYRPKYKQSENYFLDAKLEPGGTDDWWQAKPAGFVAAGTRLQHGPALSWFDNGQPKMKGQYKNDARYGRFIWWHPNGQKQLIGTYDENGHKVGPWTWWHPNGIKAIQGQYRDNAPVDVWRWWDENGQVESTENISEREAESKSADADSEIGDVPIIKEGEAEFRDPTSEQKGQQSPENAEDSNNQSTEPFKNLEEIQPLGEGQIDVLPEKLVPDDDDNY